MDQIVYLKGSRGDVAPCSMSCGDRMMHFYAQTILQLYGQPQRQAYSIVEISLVRASSLFTGRFQYSGKPFIAHKGGTASVLGSLRLPAPLVAAGLLHNVYRQGDFGDGGSGVPQVGAKRSGAWSVRKSKRTSPALPPSAGTRRRSRSFATTLKRSGIHAADVVVKSDGAIYFTDPPCGITPDQQEQPIQGVYRLSPGNELTVVASDFEKPNGLAFSPDEQQLYIDDSSRHHLRVFDVEAGGALSHSWVFHDVNVRGSGSPDGLKIDLEGHLYCTGAGGVWVFDARGNHLGMIVIPEKPANCAWGGGRLAMPLRHGPHLGLQDSGEHPWHQGAVKPPPPDPLFAERNL